MNMLVQGAPMKGPVCPVVPSVFHDKKHSNLYSHLPEWREGNTCIHTEVLRHGMEKPNLRKFNGEMADKNESCAVPLLLRGGDFLLRRVSDSFLLRYNSSIYILNFVFVEGGDAVNDHPR